MSFLTPLFLAGLASIALPFWLHYINTKNPERQRFSSTLLLEQSIRKTHVKKELQYLFLLALRILLLLLIVFAFAKPLISRPPKIIGGEDSILHLVVLDTSFSMNYEDWFTNAKTIAQQIISKMQANDVAQIISASNNIEIISAPSNIKSDLGASIDMLGPGFGRLDMGVLISRLDRLIVDYGRPFRIHLISDFQESALPPKFVNLIPTTLKNNFGGLILYPIGSREISNLSVDSVNNINSGLEVVVRAHTNIPAGTRVVLQINGEIRDQKTIESSDSDSAILNFNSGEYIPGENRVEVIISSEDSLNEDNTRYALIDNSPPLPVLLITSNINSLPAKYLTAAVETGRQDFIVKAVSIDLLDPRILQRYPWIIVDDLGIIDQMLVPFMQDYLNAGGAVFAILGDKASSLNMIPVIDLLVKPTHLSSDMIAPHTVSSIDLSHPALAETSGWRDVKVSRFMNLQTTNDVEVLVSLDDGSPLLVERKFGPGHMIVLTSSLDNKQSDIQILPVFVNFIAEVAKYLSGEQKVTKHQIAGNYLQLLQKNTSSGQVVDPHGHNLLSLEETHSSQDIKLNYTGFYEVFTSDSETFIAVNTDLRESQLSVMSDDAIKAWRDAISQPSLSDNGSSPVNIRSDDIELWHILLLIMGIVVFAESILGNKHMGSTLENI